MNDSKKIKVGTKVGAKQDEKKVIKMPDGLGWSMMFKLSNGNYMRICSLVDDPEYPFGYDYFDGKTKGEIDGGCIDLDNMKTVNDVVEEAIRWCDMEPKEIQYKFITRKAEYDDLERRGFWGF